MRHLPLSERVFKRLLVMPSGCWEWQGFRQPFGYGTIARGTREEGKVLVHRAMWEIVVGPIPEGIDVLHECDNPPCANPAHLFLGTQADNNADKTAKGRQCRGETRPGAKLSYEKARSIRADSRPQRTIAAEYGVAQRTISKVQRGEIWREPCGT